MIIWKEGDLFNSTCQTLVNTVNCVGVMGKGIALEFKKRFPSMFNAYKKICNEHLLIPGDIWMCRLNEPSLFGGMKQVMCFATKGDWRNPSRIEYIKRGLVLFVKNYKQYNISSIAFPKLGCNNGGLDWEKQVKPLMIQYLEPLSNDIKIEIWE